MTLDDALRARGIDPRHYGPGTQRLCCPECALAKYRPRDTALALTIEGERAVWLCHRCGFKGTASAHEREYQRDEHQRRAEVIRLHEARQRVESARHQDKAAQTRAIWASASPAPEDHPYLLRKRLGGDGLRYVARFQSIERALLVPLRDATGAIVNLQGIDPEGEKRFLAGAQTRGAFCTIGAWRIGEAPACIGLGEGWASTAAFCSLYPQFLGAAAMSAGNLVAVARVLRGRFPVAEIVIVADPDPAGMRAAGEAAVTVHAEIRIPGIVCRGGDWADYAQEARRAF